MSRHNNCVKAVAVRTDGLANDVVAHRGCRPLRLGLKGLPEAVTANWPKARSDHAGRYSSSSDS